MVVDVTSGAEFQAGRPRVLIDQWTFLVGPVRGWDVLPDGSFVTRVVDDDRPEHERVGATEVRIILNLFEELKERIGGGDPRLKNRNKTIGPSSEAVQIFRMKYAVALWAVR